MERQRRSERLIASLRWLVIGIGVAFVCEDWPRAALTGVLGFVMFYNGLLTYCAADPARFVRWGRLIAHVSRGLDAAVITLVVATSGSDSLAYLLYWFVLVGFGLTAANLRQLTFAAAVLIAANGVATYSSLSLTRADGEVFVTIAVRTTVLMLGSMVAVYVAMSRCQDELAYDRGACLHSILDFAARLASFTNVHELALHVLQSGVNQTGAVGGEVMLVDEETGELECEAFHCGPQATSQGEAPPEAQLKSYAKWVTNSGRDFVIRAGGRANEDANTEHDDRPAIAVPLLAHSADGGGDRVSGVLVVWGYPGQNMSEDALEILRIFAAIASAAVANLRLYTNLQRSFVSTLQSLANGLEARDDYTQGHSERVTQVSCLIAQELGVPADGVESLRSAGLLHDIGKIGVPDAILRKKGKLTVEEWETMRRHPVVSEEICRPLGLSDQVLFLIKHHQERLDGKGYPDGLPAVDQPLLLRVLVVADSFDAMRSRRPYRDRMPQEELMSELNRSAGRTLDPTVVDALKRLLERGDLDVVYDEYDRLLDSNIRVSDKQNRDAA